MSIAREALCVKGFRGLVGELVERLLHRRVVEAGVLGDGRLHVVVLHVDGEQAERRDVAGVLRHDDAGESRMSTERQASGEPEPPKVASMKSRTSRPRLALTWRRAIGTVRGRDLEDAGGAVVRVDAELRSGSSMPRLAASVSRGISPPRVWGDPAEDDVGVGDRRLGAALGVAEQAGGLRPRTAGRP